MIEATRLPRLSSRPERPDFFLFAPFCGASGRGARFMRPVRLPGWRIPLPLSLLCVSPASSAPAFTPTRSERYLLLSSPQRHTRLRIQRRIPPLSLATKSPYAAAAIIAALSVESAAVREKHLQPLRPRPFRETPRANWLFADTPPDTSSVCTSHSSAAIIVRSTKSRTTAF